MSTPPNPIQSSAPANNVSEYRAPVKKGGSLLPWLLGILGAGVVILGLLAFGIVRYILQEGVIRRQGRQVTISTPLGDLKVDHGADPGLPKYPGASLEKDSASVELTAPTDDKLEITAAHYFTSDALERVDAWYGKTLGSDFEREAPSRTRKIRNFPEISIESSATAFVSDRKDTVRLVVLKERSDGVEIKLVRIGPREAQ